MVPRPVALSLFVVMAGCLAAQDAPGEPPSAGATGRVESLTFTRCFAQELHLTIAREDADAHLPEGFVPLQTLSFDRADPTGRSAYLLLVTEVCEDVGGNGPATLFVACLPVIPPEEFAVEGALFHAIQLGAVADRPDVAAALQAWNVSAVAGTFAVDVEDLPGGARTTRVAVEAGDERLAFETRMAPEAEGGEGREEFIRLFVAPGREVAGAYDFSLAPHAHWPGTAQATQPGSGALFPRPLADATVGTDASAFDGFTLTYVPRDAL